MCFHWCSACGMLQTEMGTEKQQKAFFSFLNSILPVRCFSVGVCVFLYLLGASASCAPAMPALLLLLTLLLSGSTGPQRLVLLLLPLSLIYSSPFFSLFSPSRRFCGNRVSAQCVPPLFPSLAPTLFLVFIQYVFCYLFFCSSRF